MMKWMQGGSVPGLPHASEFYDGWRNMRLDKVTYNRESGLVSGTDSDIRSVFIRIPEGAEGAQQVLRQALNAYGSSYVNLEIAFDGANWTIYPVPKRVAPGTANAWLKTNAYPGMPQQQADWAAKVQKETGNYLPSYLNGWWKVSILTALSSNGVPHTWIMYESADGRTTYTISSTKTGFSPFADPMSWDTDRKAATYGVVQRSQWVKNPVVVRPTAYVIPFWWCSSYAIYAWSRITGERPGLLCSVVADNPLWLIGSLSLSNLISPPRPKMVEME